MPVSAGADDHLSAWQGWWQDRYALSAGTSEAVQSFVRNKVKSAITISARLADGERVIVRAMGGNDRLTLLCDVGADEWGHGVLLITRLRLSLACNANRASDPRVKGCALLGLR